VRSRKTQPWFRFRGTGRGAGPPGSATPGPADEENWSSSTILHRFGDGSSGMPRVFG
jgi:hypothetical protein